MAWTWRYEADSGDPLDPAIAPTEAPVAEPFPTRADAETWLGENWRELLDAGVWQVTLLEEDREVYGPMGLSSPV